MEGLEASWGHLNLTEEEDVVIDLAGKATAEVQNKGERCLIGKIWTDLAINKNVVEATMAKVWRLSKHTVFQEVGSNMFTMTFATHADKKRIEDGRPWFFDNNMFVNNSFDGFI